MNFQSKSEAIDFFTNKLGEDYGEGHCRACGKIWEAVIEGVSRDGAQAPALQCPRCGKMAGEFTLLKKGRVGEP